MRTPDLHSPQISRLSSILILLVLLAKKERQKHMDLNIGAIRSPETYVYRGIGGTSRVTYSGSSSHFNPLEDDNLHTIKVR